MQVKNLFLNTFVIYSSIFFSKYCMAEPYNIDDLKPILKNYHDSGEYYKEFSKVTQKIEHDIEEQTSKNKQRKYAMVMDIDETILSNYKDIIHRDFASDRAIMHRDFMKAHSKAIPAAKHLFNFAKAHHMDIFLITGRFKSEKVATLKNLNDEGFKGWKDIFFIQSDSRSDQKAIQKFKISKRKKISQKGYTILVNVGDQVSDLNGGYALKTYKLPNPFYKSQ